MITELNIQGLAIIDQLSIEFSQGFNVITGETGAGKSILIRALNFLMGGKAGPDTIRRGAEQATVIGEFRVPEGHAALQALAALGIPCEKEGDRYPILIRRTLTAKGRSQSWVNDVVVTAGPLRALGAGLVDIFGQHENQRLMDSASHVQYVDHFLPDSEVKGRCESLFRECQEIVLQLEETVETFRARERSRDYLAFRAEELKSFKPTLEDYEKIKTLSEQAQNQTTIRDTLARSLACLEGEDGSICRQLREAARLLGNFASGNERLASLGSHRERLLSLATELDDITFELARASSALDFNEEDVERAESRLFGYQDLFRKHSVREIGSLIQEAQRIEEELGFLESASLNVETLVNRLETQASALNESAHELSRARAKGAQAIKRSVEKELHELAMPGARLEIELAPMKRTLPSLDLSAFGEEAGRGWLRASESLATVGERGAERAQFLLAANPGEPILPLTKIASGGELSRIMLAMKKALAADAETCVLVFDEIDTGISGRVADVVGSKMSELAIDFQVICISHLPQVAVYADSHFLVRKQASVKLAAEGRGERTESSIVRLSGDESAREIARLLSGAEVSTPSLANARSLIERARKRAKATLPPPLPKRPGKRPPEGKGGRKMRPMSSLQEN